MRNYLFIITCTLVLNSLAVHGQEQTWRGTIMAGGGQLSFETVFMQQNDTYSGVLNILGKGFGSLTEVGFDKSLRFANPKAGISFKGALSKDGTVAHGKFSEGSSGMPLTLTKFEPVTSEPSQTWQGDLTINDMSLPMRVRIHNRAGERIITFDSLAEGKSYRGVWTERKGTIELKVPFIQLLFRATPASDGTSLDGRWSQPGRDLPFRLEKMTEDTADLDTDPNNQAVNKTKTEVEQGPIPAEAYDRLAAMVQNMVHNQEIVGGELVVIHNRKIMFRKAFGWKDLKKKIALENNAVYCVRSMTKPLVGTAIQMLIDEGRLKPETLVADILPDFKGDQTKHITIDHLLTHTSGLPLSTIRKPLAEYTDLAEVAAEAALAGPQFEPGSRFQYSDAGSDTLGVIVATVTGQPVERFIEERILKPLGMRDSFTLLADNEPMKARIPTAYSGGTAAWAKHWEPNDPPIFPIFLTSQSLYATTTDYARFLAMWMDGGKIGDQRLLSDRAISSALSPNSLMGSYPINFGGLKVAYGRQWMVAHGDQKDQTIPMVFGHDGSDGTHAWAWPELDLMVLFFTQSRGTLTGAGLSEAVQTLLVEKNLTNSPSKELRPGAAEEVAGLYWDETAINAYYVVKPMGDRLSVVRPGKMFAIFKPSDTPDRYQHEARSDRWLAFVRDEDGTVTAMRTSFGRAEELDPRHIPPMDLPSVEEVIAMVREAHHIDRLDQLGGLKMSGAFKFRDRAMEGTYELLVSGERERREISLGVMQETVMMDGKRAWSNSTQTGLEELSGQRAQQRLLDRLCVRYGDWTRYFNHIEVLKRLQVRESSLLLVRVVPADGFGSTLFVDESSGRIVRVESLLQVPGLGVVGVETSFADFRDVDGVLLPFYSEAKFASKQIGRVVTNIETVETGVEVTASSFSPDVKAR